MRVISEGDIFKSIHPSPVSEVGGIGTNIEAFGDAFFFPPQIALAHQQVPWMTSCYCWFFGLRVGGDVQEALTTLL